jgi:hypothetical protein
MVGQRENSDITVKTSTLIIQEIPIGRILFTQFILSIRRTVTYIIFFAILRKWDVGVKRKWMSVKGLGLETGLG